MKTNATKNTTVKVTIYNGQTKLTFAYTSKNGEIDENEAKEMIFSSLAKVVEQQNKLKALGAKNNFFGLSEYRENYIDIDIIKDTETSTFLSGLTFKFSQFKAVENKKEAFNIIFDTQLFLAQNHILVN